jgi:translocation and assembly module TamB
MTGSVGVLEPGIPVDIKLAAANAQPITSNVLTANLNADIGVSGKARERLKVAGTVRVNKATIGIPDSLPPDVAVLDVRRRGKPAQAAGKQAVIELDISIKAPREVLVQGRGLDAELGGELQISGTTDAPQVGGGLQLQRGSFTIASSKLLLTPDSRIGFDGTGLKKKIDPWIDFTATSTNNSAQLHITGYADAPKFDFTSNSGQSPDEFMSQLLFGETPSQLSALQLAEVGAALATLTGIGGSGGSPLTKLQRSLGLDRLSVGAGTTTTATGQAESSGAAIQAGRYVSKRVYIQGSQSTTGQSQVEVDVDLTRHLKLQTRLGNGTAVQGTTPETDPGSSVGLSYQFEY